MQLQHLTMMLLKIRCKLNIQCGTTYIHLLMSLSPEIRSLIASEVKMQINSIRFHLKKEILNELRDDPTNATRKQLVTMNSQSLAIVKEDIKNEVALMIKTQIVPKFEQLATMINYQTEDGAMSVHDYRMGVDSQNQPVNSVDNRVLSAHVRTAWGDDY